MVSSKVDNGGEGKQGDGGWMDAITCMEGSVVCMICKTVSHSVGRQTWKIPYGDVTHIIHTFVPLSLGAGPSNNHYIQLYTRYLPDYDRESNECGGGPPRSQKSRDHTPHDHTTLPYHFPNFDPSLGLRHIRGALRWEMRYDNKMVRAVDQERRAPQSGWHQFIHGVL